MKTMMKKVARALTLLTALLGAGQAMGNTYTLNTGPIEKSIIRALDTDTNAAIIYIKKTTGVSAFIYVDKLMYTKTFTVYKNIEVNDMEVLDGKLFFCGKSDTTGIVGFFDIQDLFEGSGTIKICNQLRRVTEPERHIVSNLRRMDAYKQRRTYMIVAVGDERVSASNYHYDRTCAISAMYANDNWSCSLLYDKPGDWIFQDVVCTDDLVVLTANANDGTGCYVKAFNKHSSACFLQPIDSTAIYQIASTSSQKVPWNDILGYSAGGNAMKLAFVTASAKQIALYSIMLSASTGAPTTTPVGFWFMPSSIATSTGPDAAKLKVLEYRKNDSIGTAMLRGSWVRNGTTVEETFTTEGVFPDMSSILNPLIPPASVRTYTPYSEDFASTDRFKSSYICSSSGTQMVFTTPFSTMSQCTPVTIMPCRRENAKTTKIYYNYDGMTIDVVKETCGGSIESMKAVLDCEE